MTTNHHTPIPNGAPANVEEVNGPLSQLDTKISSLDAAVSAVVAESATNVSDIAALETDVADHETRIVTLEGDMPVPSGVAGEFYNGLGSFSVPAGSGSTNGHVIQADGVDQTQRVKLNFTGPGVTVVDGPSATEIQVSAGSVPDGDYGDVVVSSSGAVMTVEAIGGKTVSTDGTLASNSDSLIPTQKAVKQYADALIASSDAMVFKNVIDCSANPDYPSADRGHTYRVSVAGKIGGASGVNVDVGDLLLCLTDGTASGDEAAAGASWAIAQANIDGAVTGAASSTSGNIATFNGSSGKVIQDGGKALPSGAILGTTDAQALTNKDLKSASNTYEEKTESVSAASHTPTGGSYRNLLKVTAQAEAFTVNAPSGTPADGNMILIKYKDNSTSRSITWDAIYNGYKPAATVAGKWTLIVGIYNSSNSKWQTSLAFQEA